MTPPVIPFHRRMIPKFVAVALLVSLIPLIFLYFYASNTASEVLIESLRNELREKSYLVGTDIDRFFNQREHDVRILSQADVLEGDDLDAIIKYLTEIIAETPYLDDIDVMNVDGVIIASSGEQNELGMQIAVQQPTLQVLVENVRDAEQGDIFVSGILELDRGPGLAFLTPITDDANTTVIKMLLVEINLGTVQRIVADFDDRVIGDKFVYLVDNDGRVIVSADPETDLLTPFPDLAVQPELLMRFSRQGDVGSVIYEDIKGEVVMAGFADMAEFGVNQAMDWSIIAIAPIAEITRPVRAFKKALLLFTVIVSSIVVLLMFLASTRIVRSVQQLVDGAFRVGSGDTKHRINADLPDEFGYLASTINQTLDNLARSERLAALGQLTATVSHELRNPLGTIRTSLHSIQVMTRDKGLGLEPALARVNRSVSRCTGIIDDLLGYGRTTDMEREPTEVDPWLDDVLGDEQFPKEVTFRRELSSGASVVLDRERFRRVVINLVQNACQSVVSDGQGPAGGDKIVTIATRLDGEGVLFSVSDNGPGIPPEILPEVFEPLFSTKIRGVGLGLTVVKEVTERHGGTVTATNDESGGARVDVWLPLERAAT